MNTRTILLISVCLTLLCSCVSTPEKQSLSLAEVQMRHGLDFENKGELFQALYKYKVAKELAGNLPELEDKITRIEAALIKQANQHYAKGIKYYTKKRKRKSRRQLIKALKIYPLHNKSLNFLKQNFPQIYISYEVKKGDTRLSIAKNIYANKDKKFLLDYFIQTIPLSVGEKISLPIIDVKKLSASVAKPLKKDKGEHKKYEQVAETNDEVVNPKLTKASQYIQAKEYAAALSLVYQSMENDPENYIANQLRNQAYYELGLSKVEEKEYVSALDLFNKVDPDYKNIRQELAKLNRQLTKLADQHYKNGVNYFVNEKLEKAISQWEITLKYNSQHVDALKNLIKARNLIDKLKQY